MEPRQLIPAAETISVAWPWFKALLIPCFAVHLIFMNALLGTAVIGWVHLLRFRTPGLETPRGIGRRLPFFMAFTINFGVAALLFMQVLYGHLFYTSSILMAVWWLSALALVLMVYGAAYWIDFKFDGLGRGRILIWTVMVAGLLLVGFTFASNMTLMLDPGSWGRYFQDPSGKLWHWDDPTLPPRYLHFVTASVAVGGLVLAVVNRNRPAEDKAGFMQWFTAATALQAIIGGWFFIALPAPVRQALMGGDTQASVLFGLALLGFLLTLAFGIKQLIWPSAGAVLFTVLTMVLVRDAVRTLYLAPYFSVEQLAVRPQYSPLLVFGIFVVLGIAAVGYLVRLYLNAKGAGAQ
jgi:hypothetical protein